MTKKGWNEWELIGHQLPLNEKELARLSSTASRLGVTPWELSIFKSIWYEYGQVDSKDLLIERAFGSSYEKNPQKVDAAIDRVFDQKWVQFLSIEFLNEMHTELKKGNYLMPQGLTGNFKEIANTPESNVGIISFTRTGAPLFMEWIDSIYPDSKSEDNIWVLESHDDDWSSVYGKNLNACLDGIRAVQVGNASILEIQAPEKIGRWCNRWWQRFENGYRIRFKHAEKQDHVIMKVKYNDFKFVIEEDHPDVGVYLYVYSKGKCIRDELQDDIETCIEIAFEDYAVPRELWKPSGVGQAVPDKD